jgi:hypothetical protein
VKKLKAKYIANLLYLYLTLLEVLGFRASRVRKQQKRLLKYCTHVITAQAASEIVFQVCTVVLGIGLGSELGCMNRTSIVYESCMQGSLEIRTYIHKMVEKNTRNGGKCQLKTCKNLRMQV